MAVELLLWRGLATVAVVFAVVWVFRRRGQRAAGVLAALPLLSAPTLLTLSLDHSAAIAAAAAVSGLRGTGLTALLVLLYGLWRRHAGAAQALVFSGLGALLAAWLARGLLDAFLPTLAATVCLVALARHALPRLVPGESPCRFLRGYLDGLLVRCSFLAVLVPALAPLGGWLAFALAMLAAVGVLNALGSLRGDGPGSRPGSA